MFGSVAGEDYGVEQFVSHDYVRYTVTSRGVSSPDLMIQIVATSQALSWLNLSAAPDLFLIRWFEFFQQSTFAQRSSTRALTDSGQYLLANDRDQLRDGVGATRAQARGVTTQTDSCIVRLACWRLAELTICLNGHILLNRESEG